MRLIDADAFLKSEIERCGCVPLIGSCTSDNEVFKFILEKQPTVEAIPKEKLDEIVERLEEESEECRKYWDEFDDADSFGGMNAYCRAISIVKEVGGINAIH